MAPVIPARNKSGSSARSWSRRWLPSVCLVAGVALVYWNTLRAPFLFDDTGAVVNNPTIRRLWSLDAFTPPADGSTTTGRPVVNLSYALNIAISGESVWSYHALNLTIHALAALTLMGVVRRTLSGPVLRERLGTPAGPFAFLTALLWVLHPLQTESVVCIAQRTESLCGLFYLLTFYGFARATGQMVPGRAVLQPAPPHPEVRAEAPHDADISSRTWFAVSLVSCLLGMATKEVMVTAPVLLLLYDRTFVSRTFASAWRRRRAFYTALAATWLVLAWLVVRGGGARAASAGFGLGVSWWAYLLTQSEAIVLYLKLAFWPDPLVLDYGTAVANSLAAVWWQAAVVGALLAGTVWSLARKPVAGFLGAWFFVILAPSSSVVPLVTQTMAEHRMYLPLAAVMSLVVSSLHGRAGARAPWLLAAAAVGLGGVTFSRNRDYRDAIAIWTDTVVKSPLNARAHNNLAWALQQQGRADAANVHFARAVDLQPRYVSARYNWGVALLNQGRAVEAIAQLETAVRLAPDHADAHVNLGNALMQVQRAADAVPHYEAALRLNPGPDVHYDLAVALLDLGRHEEATARLRAALQLDPNLSETHYQLGRLAEAAGQPGEAERHYAETLRLAPDHLAAHRKLGLLLAHGERFDAAAAHFRAVIRLQPLDADAHANLGNVLLLGGHAREAVACYEESLRLRPGDARTRENLLLARESLR